MLPYVLLGLGVLGVACVLCFLWAALAMQGRDSTEVE